MDYHKFAPFCALLFGLTASVQAGINVNGSTVYTQDFDSLPTATGRSEFSWTDDVTVQGFYLHRSNSPASPQVNLAGVLNTAAARPYVSDGSEVANTAPNFHGFLSLGNYLSGERALGASPTTTDGSTNWSGGELSIVAIFTNTGTTPTDLTSLSFDIEAWRGNSAAANAETISLTAKTGTAAALLAELGARTATGTFNNAGWTAVSNTVEPFGYTSTDGFTATPGVPPSSITRSGTLSSAIRLAPGQSLALRWGNINETGNDAQLGIDNLSATFTAPSAAVTASTASVVRSDAGTPFIPTDDTVGFNLTIVGSGAVSGNWEILAPASLAGTGTNGVPKALTAPIADFTGPGHTLTVTVQDQGNPGTNTTFTITAPWTTIVGTASNFNYNEAGTPDDASDDTVSYQANATGTFTGSTYSVSENGGVAQTSPYGTPLGLTAAAAATGPTAPVTLLFTDSADPTVTSTIIANPPAIIGRSTLSGSPVNLYSAANFGNNTWTFDGTSRTWEMTDGDRGGAGLTAKEVRSATVNLAGVSGVVKLSLDLVATDGSSGFEDLDTFYAGLILNDGTSDLPEISLITSQDTNANGIMNGAEIVAANTSRTHNLVAFIPDNIQSARLVVRGICDSLITSELMRVQNFLVELAPATLDVVGGVTTFNNQGTVDPTDDTISAPATINSVNLGASTGWTSTGTPASGLYSAANPVAFTALASASPVTVTLTDVLAPLSDTITLTRPATTFTASAANIVRVENGPGLADDTLTFDLTVSGNNGGPEYTLATYPAMASVGSNVLTSTPTVHSVTISPAPEHGVVSVRVADASYATSRVDLAITAPAPTAPATSYILGQKNLGGGLSDVTTDASALSAQWHNYPSLRVSVMTNGATEGTLSSEVIDISTTGDVQFTANIKAIDRTTGFEVEDTLIAELILDGNTANPVVLTSPYDTNTSGRMNGGPTDAEDEFAVGAAGDFTNDFSLVHTIPATANSVQLVVRAVNNSNNESFLIEDVLFESTGPVDTDTDGMDDAYEVANGLNPNSAADKFLDKDGDGVNNYAEFLAGTLANDPNSKLEYTVHTVNSTTGAYTITWKSVPGKKYRLQGSTNLQPGSWTDIGAEITPTTTTATVSGTLTAPVPDRIFLNVRIVP